MTRVTQLITKIKNNTSQYSFNESSGQSNYNCNLSLENPEQDSKENPGQNSEDSWWDVAFQELSKDGVLETSFSLKNQREQFKKSLKKKEVISESNISLPRVETLRVIPNKMLEELKDDKLSIPMYLMNRDKYIELLSQILETNFSPAVNKLLKRMIRLANLKQHVCCWKIGAMIKIYENSFSNKTKVVYRSNAAL